MAIELRPAIALDLWHEATLALVRLEGHDLSLRQMAILLHVYLVPPPHTVRGLAATLCVTKPVITRALDTLGEMGFVTRVRDPVDGRNVIIKRTVEGALHAERIGDLIVAVGKRI
ncbi:MarR family winged helix-turn-helix transcriptional regulator [Pararhizobium haloflavum]|uniref:MarR family winged helix-turn-helix transcriptional regulator n=1 Tax=Pararhizobium haloflavum TaxID=2037914 RepID=UPI000C1A37CB|nr:MarR family winged helix-turn-helix transcriptional regulator [Pararhizobium haloflavum]